MTELNIFGELSI